MSLEVDSEMEVGVVEAGDDPRVFVPAVNLFEIEDPSIIDQF